jgi:hypothetical protein
MGRNTENATIKKSNGGVYEHAIINGHCTRFLDGPAVAPSFGIRKKSGKYIPL